MRKILFQLFIFNSFILFSQTDFRTQINSENIKTLQIGVAGQDFGTPLIEMNSSEILEVSFDEMSHEAHSYSYKVIHCNADWTPTDISSTEYIQGFTTSNITDYTLSINTTYLYTHYKFSLPNYDMSFKISGNYVVIIYEDNQPEKPIAQACFSIVEPKISITGSVRGNTDTELNRRFQQLDFNVNLNGYSVRDASSELKVLVRQNNRIDNQVTDLKPTYYSGSKLDYINNKALIFEGGYEYHSFDISSVYSASERVENIKYNQTHYDAYLIQDKIKPSNSYIYEPDVNGKYIINMQRSDDDDIEGDYMIVHFSLDANSPFFDGQLYLGGEFNYNLMNKTSRMKYDIDTKSYYQSILLKQGGYNYQYWFVPKGSTKALTERVDGTFWQTKNEYTIYVYHRAWGERYDKLIAVKVIE